MYFRVIIKAINTAYIVCVYLTMDNENAWQTWVKYISIVFKNTNIFEKASNTNTVK